MADEIVYEFRKEMRKILGRIALSEISIEDNIELLYNSLTRNIDISLKYLHICTPNEISILKTIIKNFSDEKSRELFLEVLEKMDNYYGIRSDYDH